MQKRMKLIKLKIYTLYSYMYQAYSAKKCDDNKF